MAGADLSFDADAFNVVSKWIEAKDDRGSDDHEEEAKDHRHHQADRSGAGKGRHKRMGLGSNAKPKVRDPMRKEW